MARDENVQFITLPAAADLSAKQYFGVVINSSGQAALAGDGARIDGVLYNKPAAAGRAATVAISGRVKISIGATLAPGDEVGLDAAGEFVPTATGDKVAGHCIEGGADGNIGSMLLRPEAAGSATA